MWNSYLRMTVATCDDLVVDRDASFRERYGSWAVVLGASEGLGAAWAHGLAARALDVRVGARRDDLLQQVADDVAGQHGVLTRALALDLAEPDFLMALQRETDALDVGFVVYNGAAGYVGPLKSQPLDSLRAIVAVNCTGPLMVCHHFGSRMIDRGR